MPDTACAHSRYKNGDYMTLSKAMRIMESGSNDPKDKRVCWHGISIKNCEDCGVDISMHLIVQVKDVNEYMDGL